MKIPGIIFTSLALTLVAGEALVQLLGVVDIPLYRADPTLGYIPAPSQSGNFLNFKQWQFNEYSMGSGAFEPDSRRFNMLLLGDSTVMGGNPLTQSERLGLQLEDLTGWQVWPVSAGSWALQNQLAYIQKYPQLLDKVDAVAIVSNSGDFDGPSSWASNLTHPLKRPFPGLLYAAQKYVFPSAPPPEISAELKVVPRDWRADLRDLSGSFRKPVVIFLFPTSDELDDSEKMRKQLDSIIPALQAQSAGNLKIVQVAASPLWNSSFYRDSIHPNADGNAALAKILRSSLCESTIQKMACLALSSTTPMQ